jgi:hypothetical protein
LQKIMKEFTYKPEKREKVLTERWIDLEIIAHMIKEWSYIWIMQVPSRPYQKMFVLYYDNYVCCVPYDEDDKYVYLRTAYYSRKMKKLLDGNN